MERNYERKSNRNRFQYGSKSDSSLPLARALVEEGSSSGHGPSSLGSYPGTEATPDTSRSFGDLLPGQNGICTSKRRYSSEEPERLRESGKGIDEQQAAITAFRQDLLDRAIPSQRDFEEDPAHKYWKWSVQEQSWYHVNQLTGAIFWAPHQLD
ncbi:hypothetical protein CT0861_02132 [Colletotrichum tofieldiae]|uniref:Uncharacterized protein n=1 Tax=Colletotrichum tofieldiae TaxID=708197 RepID=A0A166Z8H1_9PEZI|nr:hypothetical protein CT0861_02132 [Colletotrichum tofieldiae]